LGSEDGDKTMKQLMQSYKDRITLGVHAMGVGLDPDVLMLPGGSLLALALWLYEHRPKHKIIHTTTVH
jgi:hypothetical protein